VDQKPWVWAVGGVIAAIGFIVLLSIAMGSNGKDLVGPTWVVTELSAGGSSAAPSPGTVLTAIFDGETVGGDAGCNNFTGGYEVSGDSISFGPLATTRMFCEESMDQEGVYLALLQSADSFDVDGAVLRLSHDGTTVITYEALDG